MRTPWRCYSFCFYGLPPPHLSLSLSLCWISAVAVADRPLMSWCCQHISTIVPVHSVFSHGSFFGHAPRHWRVVFLINNPRQFDPFFPFQNLSYCACFGCPLCLRWKRFLMLICSRLSGTSLNNPYLLTSLLIYNVWQQWCESYTKPTLILCPINPQDTYICDDERLHQLLTLVRYGHITWTLLIKEHGTKERKTKTINSYWCSNDAVLTFKT